MTLRTRRTCDRFLKMLLLIGVEVIVQKFATIFFLRMDIGLASSCSILKKEDSKFNSKFKEYRKI